MSKQDEIQDDINQSLGGLPPWVSEDTLGNILSLTQTENDKLKEAFKSLTGKEFPLDAIKQRYADAGKSFKKANKLAIGLESNTTSLLSSISSSRDTDPLAATAELMKMTAGAIDGAVGAVTQYTSLIPGAGRAVSLVLKGVTGLGVAASGVAVIYAKLISEQEKALRTIINYGGVVGDLSQYTTMRDAVSSVGMSMQEMSKLMDGNKVMLANLPDDLIDTTTQFIKFAGTVESTNKKTMGSFGYNVEQQTSRLLEEAKLMYMSGQLEQFSQATKDKIRKKFESSSIMTTFLAGTFGDQRSALLAMRSEALTNVDFMSALTRNGEYLAEQYGENAVANVKASAASMKMLFSKVLGPEFGAQSEQVLNNFIKDVQIDASALNNMPKEMINMLSALGPEVSNKFKDIIEKGGTGQLTENQTVMAIQDLAKSVAKAQPRLGDDPIIQQSNALIANARIAPEAFMDMTEATLSSGLDSVRALTAQASGSIEAIDDARIAFRTIVTTMEPGYDKSATALGFFAGSLGLIEGALKLVGLIPRDDLPPLPTEPLTKEELSTMFLDAIGPDTGPGYDIDDTNEVDPVTTTQESTPDEKRISNGQGFGANANKIVFNANSSSVVKTRGPDNKNNKIVSNTKGAAVVKTRGPSRTGPSNAIAPVVNNNTAPVVNNNTAPVVNKPTSSPISPNNSRTPVSVSSVSKPANTKMSVHLAIMSLLDNKIMDYMKDITEETNKAALMENIHGQ